MKKRIRISFIFTTITFLLTVSIVPHAFADDTASTGNGAVSDNNITVHNDNQTNIQSSNNASISNNVTTNTNTGGNKATANSNGNTSITTGNIVAGATISNELNKSTISTGDDCNCAAPSSTTTVTNNGADSSNAVHATNNTSTGISVSNNASITNNVSTYANTGNNSANYNIGGDTHITTGNIYIKNTIDNGPVNLQKVTISKNTNYSVNDLLKIAGNGAFSLNSIESKNNNKVTIDINNYADIINNVDTKANTGKNEVSYNTGGDTYIKTGDIFSETSLTTVANLSEVIVRCGCHQQQQTPIPMPPVTNTTSAPVPSITTTTTANSGTPSTTGLVAAAAANMLPTTGNGLLYFFMLANIIMLFLGAYLRLRSGNAPSYKFAF